MIQCQCWELHTTSTDCFPVPCGLLECNEMEVLQEFFEQARECVWALVRLKTMPCLSHKKNFP